MAIFPKLAKRIPAPIVLGSRAIPHSRMIFLSGWALIDEVIKLQRLADQLMMRLPTMYLRDRRPLQVQFDPQHARKGLEDHGRRWKTGFAFITGYRGLVF